MWLPGNQKGPQTLTMMVLLSVISSFTDQVSATLSKKLNEELVPSIGQTVPDYDTGIKCGACPCANPCGQLPPPPPPLPLPPPPPPPPPSLPPRPKTPSCTPLAPPPPRFIYVTGVPGQIYPTDVDNWDFYSRAECNVAKKLLLWVGWILCVGNYIGVIW